MKIVIIGGGAHRVLGIVRGALAVPGVLEKGEICIYDLNASRAEAMGRMILKTPELRATDCKVRWNESLEVSLTGADVVGVIMPAGSRRSHALGDAPSIRHGFISSDNLSPNGAIAAVRIAPTILGIARKMEEVCPNAWLVNFVNPIATLAAMVNNHTKIKALGVCQGFTNHLWDVSRLMGIDSEAQNLEVTAAGVNHLSYILNGTWEGRDLLTEIAARLDGSGEPSLVLQEWWNDVAKQNIRNSVSRLVRFWRELGVLVFSSEQDGMDHLMYDEAVESCRQGNWNRSVEEVERDLEKDGAARAEADASFQAWLGRDLDQAFWEGHWKADLRFKREDEDVFVRIFAAIAGVKEAKIVTSYINNGAISGIKDTHVVEYTQRLFKDRLIHDGPYDLPTNVQGMAVAFAAHQTMMGDALALREPKLLARALMCYPVSAYSRRLGALYRELFEINRSDIAPELLKAGAFL